LGDRQDANDSGDRAKCIPAGGANKAERRLTPGAARPFGPSSVAVPDRGEAKRTPVYDPVALADPDVQPNWIIRATLPEHFHEGTFR